MLRNGRPRICPVIVCLNITEHRHAHGNHKEQPILTVSSLITRTSKDSFKQRFRMFDRFDSTEQLIQNGFHCRNAI